MSAPQVDSFAPITRAPAPTGPTAPASDACGPTEGPDLPTGHDQALLLEAVWRYLRRLRDNHPHAFVVYLLGPILEALRDARTWPPPSVEGPGEAFGPAVRRLIDQLDLGVTLRAGLDGVRLADRLIAAADTFDRAALRGAQEHVEVWSTVRRMRAAQREYFDARRDSASAHLLPGLLERAQRLERHVDTMIARANGEDE